MKNKKAFTLVELMVVIAIIGILAVMGIANYAMAIRKGRDAKQKSDISNIQQALILYRADMGHYPVEGDLNNLVPNYMAQIPKQQKKDSGEYKYTPSECSGTACKKFTLCTGKLEAKISNRSASGANSDMNEKISTVDCKNDGTDCIYYCVTNP